MQYLVRCVPAKNGGNFEKQGEIMGWDMLEPKPLGDLPAQ